MSNPSTKFSPVLFQREKIPSTLAIALIFLVFAVLVPMINHSITGEHPVEPGVRLDVGLGVSILPPSNWNLNVEGMNPGTDITRGSVSFSSPSGWIIIVASEYTSGDLQAFESLVIDRMKKAMRHFSVKMEHQSIITRNGDIGISHIYLGTGLHGQYVVFVQDDIAVAVTISGPDYLLSRNALEIMSLVKSISFTNLGAKS